MSLTSCCFSWKRISRRLLTHWKRRQSRLKQLTLPRRKMKTRRHLWERRRRPRRDRAPPCLPNYSQMMITWGWVGVSEYLTAMWLLFLYHLELSGFSIPASLLSFFPFNSTCPVKQCMTRYIDNKRNPMVFNYFEVIPHGIGPNFKTWFSPTAFYCRSLIRYTRSGSPKSTYNMMLYHHKFSITHHRLAVPQSSAHHTQWISVPASQRVIYANSRLSYDSSMLTRAAKSISRYHLCWDHWVGPPCPLGESRTDVSPGRVWVSHQF